MSPEGILAARMRQTTLRLTRHPTHGSLFSLSQGSAGKGLRLGQGKANWAREAEEGPKQALVIRGGAQCRSREAGVGVTAIFRGASMFVGLHPNPN